MLGRLFDGPQILIVIFIIVLIFAAPKLPGLAKNLGKSMKIFKTEVKNLRDDDDDESGSEPSEPQRPIEGNVVDNKRDSNSSGSETSSKTTPHSDS